MFAREVNSSDILKAALADVVFFKVDCEKGDGPALAKQFEIRAYPTYYVVNAGGEPVEHWVGYEDAAAWAEVVAAAHADPRPLTAKRTAHEAKPTAALAISLANDTLAKDDYAGAVKLFRQARDLDPARAAMCTENIFMAMIYGAGEGLFTFAELQGEGDRILAAPTTTTEDRVELASLLLGAARDQGHVEGAVPYLVDALKAAEGLPEDTRVARTLKGLRVDHALLVEKDAPKAVELRKAMMPEGWLQEARRLNQFAWWCFQNGVNLDEAETLIVQAVDLAGDDGEKARCLDTAAEISLARGRTDEAVARAQRAVELQPERQEYKEQLAKFTAAAAKKG